MATTNHNGLAVQEDDCPVTSSVRAALYCTDLKPSEDDVMSIVSAITSDFPELGERGEIAAFEPEWPDGLEQLRFYEFPCDDKGRDGGSWLRVMVAGDGDVHVSMQDWEDIKREGSAPSPNPSVRCRTLAGGGRYRRTRQALLWLAQAIRLDNAELGVSEGQ